MSSFMRPTETIEKLLERKKELEETLREVQQWFYYFLLYVPSPTGSELLQKITKTLKTYPSDQRGK